MQRNWTCINKHALAIPYGYNDKLISPYFANSIIKEQLDGIAGEETTLKRKRQQLLTRDKRLTNDQP